MKITLELGIKVTATIEDSSLSKHEQKYRNGGRCNHNNIVCGKADIDCGVDGKLSLDMTESELTSSMSFIEKINNDLNDKVQELRDDLDFFMATRNPTKEATTSEEPPKPEEQE